MARRPRTLISLFSGAGGLDLGLEGAGFETRVMVEIDRDARTTVETNRAFFRRSSFPILDDITAYSPAEILESAGLAPGEVTLVAGGPPCQSFSTAGRRQAINDPRGSLFLPFAAVIEYAQPRFFIMENVRGLLSAAIRHRPLNRRGPGFPPLEADEEPGSALRVIHKRLTSFNYDIRMGLLNTVEYGVPQTRQRLVILGSRDHEFPATRELRELIRPTHSPTTFETLASALEGIPAEPPVYTPYSARQAAVFARIPEGQNWRHLRDTDPDLAQEVMGGAFHSTGGRVGFFRRLDRRLPSPTLPTSPLQKSTALCHPRETRPLSIQEYAAIQQFPTQYVFSGTVASQYKQIGNAVPVGFGRAIGRAVSKLCTVNPLQGIDIGV